MHLIYFPVFRFPINFRVHAISGKLYIVNYYIISILLCVYVLLSTSSAVIYVEDLFNFLVAIQNLLIYFMLIIFQKFYILIIYKVCL